MTEEKTRERKERVIHARIPPGLEEDLKRLSEALRVPMSNLVRNILQDTVTAVDRVGRTFEELVGDVSSHVGHEAVELRRKWAHYQTERDGASSSKETPQASEKKAEEPAPDPLRGVFGFQPIVLNVKAKCANCQKSLPRGARAHLGLTDRARARIFVCESCVPGISDEEE